MPSRVPVLVIAGVVLLVLGGAFFVYSRQVADTPNAGASVEATPSPSPTGTAEKPAPAKPSGSPTTSKPSPAPTTPTPAVEAAPTLGTLIIESDVPETSVFIDRVYLGNAPVTAKNLTPGTHRLNMSATGYEGIFETIEVEAGTRTLSIKFKEIKLDETIAVTHKHAMGSCSGTLRASPQRLTYDTTNAGDAFAVPLTNLDTFEVDYLEKNLRIKVRDGKTYNFTDKDGDVNRLYRFHQNVEKVRQRLLSGRQP